MPQSRRSCSVWKGRSPPVSKRLCKWAERFFGAWSKHCQARTNPKRQPPTPPLPRRFRVRSGRSAAGSHYLRGCVTTRNRSPLQGDCGGKRSGSQTDACSRNACAGQSAGSQVPHQNHDRRFADRPQGKVWSRKASQRLMDALRVKSNAPICC